MVIETIHSLRPYSRIIIVVFLIFSSLSNSYSQEIISKPNVLADKAFIVLEKKCNTCHLERDPNKLFTKENMTKNFKKINRQVFIWKRMPQGEDHDLTEIEASDLNAWILNLKSKKNLFRK